MIRASYSDILRQGESSDNHLIWSKSSFTLTSTGDTRSCLQHHCILVLRSTLLEHINCHFKAIFSSVQKIWKPNPRPRKFFRLRIWNISHNPSSVFMKLKSIFCSNTDQAHAWCFLGSVDRASPGQEDSSYKKLHKITDNWKIQSVS